MNTRKRVPRVYFLAVCIFACRSHVDVCKPDCETSQRGGRNTGGANTGGANTGGANTGATATGDVSSTAGLDEAGVSNGGIASGVDQAGAPLENGGAGGASGTVGGAGAGGSAECDDDDDCRDRSVCNGVERCEHGACEPGEPLPCEPGTTCDDGFPSEPCGFTEPAPWVLLYNENQVWGLRTSELGKREPIELSAREMHAPGTLLSYFHFSPDGRHVLVTQSTSDVGHRMFELHLGRGLPKPLRPIANLPNWGKYSSAYFAADSRGALIQDSNSGFYWLDLSAQQAVPSPLALPPQEHVDLLQFCRDGRSFILPQDRSTLLHFGADERLDIPLGPDANLARNQNQIFFPGPRARVALCPPTRKSVSLNVSAETGFWTFDSRYLVVTLSDASTKIYSVSEDLTVTERWSGAVAGDWILPIAMVADTLVLRRPDDAKSVYAYLNLSDPTVELRDLRLPSTAQSLHCNEAGCLAWIPQTEAGVRELVFQTYQSQREPVFLARDPGNGREPQHGIDRRRLVFFDVTSEQDIELRVVDFREEPATERHVWTWRADEHVKDYQVAHDMSGVIVKTWPPDGDVRLHWLSLSEKDASPVALDVPAYSVAFQPWY